jgi:hypothetical protein
MKTNQQQTMNPDTIRGPGPVLLAPLRLAESVERDKLSAKRPLREPHFSDGDLLHGDGP